MSHKKKVNKYFDFKRYDLAAAGRFKLNNKLSAYYRMLNKIVAENSRNKVTVSQDGTMEIAAISADRIVQTGDTWLILNGGSASL